MRFEVYASLNQLIAVAERPTVLLFAERMAAILALCRKDITKLEDNLGITDCDDKENFDAMDVRKLYQCLKFTTAMVNILFRLGSNYFDTIAWYHKHATEVLQNGRLSRGILSPYISIIKEVTPLLKTQRDFFNANNLPALALDAVLNMKQLNSSAIISDRFLALRSLVTHFPGTMGTRIQRWLPSLLVNVFRMPPVIQSKCQTIAIQTLFEAARSFIDDSSTLSKIQILMDSPIPFNISYFFQGDNVQSLYEGKLLIEFVLEELQNAVDVDESKNALDIWTAITILVGGPHFHKWPPLELWIKFLFDCQKSKNEGIRRKAFYAWRAVIHNTCYYSLANVSYLLKVDIKLDNTKDIIKLLLRLFTGLNEKFWSDSVITNEVASLALSIIYSFLNQRNVQKYHSFYWSDVINSLLQNSILKLQDDNAYYLFKQLMVTENIQEDFNQLRCLSHDSVETKEICPLTQKWVHANVPILSVLVEGILEGNSSIAFKFDILKLLINKLKSIIKRELKASEGTDNLLKLLPKWNILLLKSDGFNAVEYVEYLGLVIDTFDKDDLLNFSEDNFLVDSLACLSEVLLPLELKLVVQKLNDLLDQDSISVLVDGLSSRSIYTTDLPFLLRDICKSREIFLKLSGKILTYCDDNYDAIVDDILSMSPTQFACAKDFLDVWLPVNMHLWKWNALGYLAIKAHAAKQVNVRALVIRFLKIKIESSIDTMKIFRFMIDNDLHDFLYQMGSTIFESSKSLEALEILDFTRSWRSYLMQQSKSEDFKALDKLLLMTLMHSDIDILPYIRGRWDDLPKLKRRWLKKYEKLPIVTDVEESPVAHECDSGTIVSNLTESVDESSLFSVNGSINKDSALLSTQISKNSLGEDLSEVSMSDNKDSWSSHADYESMKHRLELKESNLLSPRIEVPMTQEDDGIAVSSKSKVHNQLHVIPESSGESGSSLESLLDQSELQLYSGSIASSVLSNKAVGHSAEPNKTRQFARLVAEMKALISDELVEEANRLSPANGMALNSTLSELIDIALHVKANLLK